MQIFSRNYNNTWFVVIKLNLYFQDTQRRFTNNENSFMICVSNVTSSPLQSWVWVHFTWKKKHFKRGHAAVTHRALTQRSLDLCHCYSWHVAKHVIQAVFIQKLWEGGKKSTSCFLFDAKSWSHQQLKQQQSRSIPKDSMRFLKCSALKRKKNI